MIAYRVHMCIPNTFTEIRFVKYTLMNREFSNNGCGHNEHTLSNEFDMIVIIGVQNVLVHGINATLFVEIGSFSLMLFPTPSV